MQEAKAKAVCFTCRWAGGRKENTDRVRTHLRLRGRASSDRNQRKECYYGESKERTSSPPCAGLGVWQGDGIAGTDRKL